MIALDASVVAAWYLDRHNLLAAAAFDALADEDAVAPGNLLPEVVQALLRAERQRRVTAEDLQRAANELPALPVAIDPPPLGRIVSIARHYDLNAYDAAYLAVAIDRKAPLATIDGRLRQAAQAARILWEPEGASA